MPVATIDVYKDYVSLRKEARGAHCVYLIQCGDDGPIKIGSTHKNLLTNRLYALQNGNHQPLHLRSWMATEPIHEKVLHAMFAEHRIRGEWYEPVDDLLAIIEAMSLDDVTDLRIMLHRMTKAYSIESLAELDPNIDLEDACSDPRETARRLRSKKIKRQRELKGREYPPEPNERRWIT